MVHLILCFTLENVSAVDCLLSLQNFANTFEVAAPRSGDTSLGIEMVDFYRKEKTLVGCNTLLYSVEDFAEDLKEMEPKFDAGLLKGAKPGEWKEVKLEDGVEAYEKASQRGAGKFVVVMD